MKIFFSSISAWSRRIAGLALAAFFLAGCGSQVQTPESALAELGYGLSAGDFLLAADAGDLRAMRLFHELGVAPDQADEKGGTASMRAAAGGSEEVVAWLLDAGGSAKAVDSEGRSVLMHAAEAGHAGVARLLLSRGAEAKVKDGEGWTALKLAAYHGYPEVVELLAGKEDASGLDEALLLASLGGNPRVISHLLAKGAYINTRSPGQLTPLMIAAQEGHADAVDLLLRHQANPYSLDADENTAANLAEAAGHLELRDLLLDPAAILEVIEGGRLRTAGELADAGEIVPDDAAPAPANEPAGFVPAGTAEESAPVPGQSGRTPASPGASRLASRVAAEEEFIPSETPGVVSLRGRVIASDSALAAAPTLKQDGSAASPAVPSGASRPSPESASSVEGSSGQILAAAPPAAGQIQASAADSPRPETPAAAAAPPAGGTGPVQAGDSGSAAPSGAPDSAARPGGAVAAYEAGQHSAADAAPAAAKVDRWTGGGAAVERFRMVSYREEPLPVMLKGVDPAGEDGGAPVAHVRVLSSREIEPVAVRQGELIPGTRLRLKGTESRTITSKMGKGQLVDVSTMTVEDTVSGAKHLLVKDVPGRSSNAHAILALPGSPHDYRVESGDAFSAAGQGEALEEFMVLDVRPTQVVIRNQSSGEVVTVQRDGIAMR